MKSQKKQKPRNSEQISETFSNKLNSATDSKALNT